MSSLIGLTGFGFDGRSIGRRSNFPGEGRRGIRAGGVLLAAATGCEGLEPGRWPRGDCRCERSPPCCRSPRGPRSEPPRSEPLRPAPRSAPPRSGPPRLGPPRPGPPRSGPPRSGRGGRLSPAGRSPRGGRCLCSPPASVDSLPPCLRRRSNFFAPGGMAVSFTRRRGASISLTQVVSTSPTANC